MAVRDLSTVGDAPADPGGASGSGASGGVAADPGDPARCAALAAPLVDRVLGDTMRAAMDAGGRELLARHGGAASALLVEYRTALAHPGRTVSREQLAEVARCCAPVVAGWPPGDPDAAWRHVGALAAAGLVEIESDRRFRATIAGLDLLREVYRLHGEVTAARWRGHGDRVGRLARTAGRLLARIPTTSGPAAGGGGISGAAASGGVTAFGAMAPPHEPAGTPYGVLLLNRLAALHYHRADAYAAACRAAGHPTTQPAHAPPAGIEAAADRLAAAAYAALPAGERRALIADLAALP